MLSPLTSRRFRPPTWAVLLTIALAAAFVRLGFWQIHRAQEKKAMISAYLEAAKAQPADFNAAVKSGADTAPLLRHAVQLRGRLDPKRTLLLDNQVSHEQPGYHVWSPLRLEGGDIIALVDRGWIPMGVNRRQLPEVSTPDDTISLRGVWQPLPRPGLRLGKDDCNKTQWPRVVEYPLYGELQCLLGPRMADGILWLEPQAPNGFRREWHQSSFPPERHYGYAFQWFALAATLLVVFVAVNIRKVGSNE